MVFRNFVLTQICVHDIFDVFMCNNIQLYQALPIIICTSPNVTTQSRPFTSVLSCSLKYDILHVSLKLESFIDTHIYLYNLCTFFWQMWYIHFFCQGNTEILIVVHTNMSLRHYHEWMAIFSLHDAICVHCTIISYLKIYSNQRQQG